jgi:hypothetical protein
MVMTIIAVDFTISGILEIASGGCPRLDARRYNKAKKKN